MSIRGRKGEWGAQCTPGEYVKMVEAKFYNIILPSTQAEFGCMEANGF